MGEKNSSVTRVWPVFDCLFSTDATGKSWLPDLLRLGSRADKVVQKLFDDSGSLLPELLRFDRALSGPLKKVLGPERVGQVCNIRAAFEVDVPPAHNFLKWLLQNPDRLQWPQQGNKKCTYGATTQARRKALIEGNVSIQEEALQELGQFGAERSRRKWWAFEGYTSVDCILETETLVVLVEGKRTEPLSSSTHWFPERNQIIRNLECARMMASTKGKGYAVLICAEELIDILDSAWVEGLPHMTEHERCDLKSHFLGCATWESIVANMCGDMELPHDIDSAITLCKRFR